MRVARGRFVTKLIREFPLRVGSAAASYAPRAYGEKRSDGRWEGWLEFSDARTGEIILTGRETTQSDLLGLRYWASGLGRAFLEGALVRARRRFGASILHRGLV